MKAHLVFPIFLIFIATIVVSTEENNSTNKDNQPGPQPEKEFNIKCFAPGIVIMEDDGTTCFCVSFLFAKCIRNTQSTTPNPNYPTNPTLSTENPFIPKTTTTNPTIAAQDPFFPLTSDEIKMTSQIIEASKTRAATRYIYNYITLQEPPKAIILPYFLSDTPIPPKVYPRKSFSVLLERSTGNVYEAVVNLDTRMQESLNQIQNVTPSYSPEDQINAEKITRADPTVQARCAAIGYPNMSLVNADPWSIGYIGDMPQFQGMRLMQQYIYGKNFDDDNQYAHPIDFMPIVNLNTQKVIAIVELPTHDNFDATNKAGNVVPRTEANYDYRFRGGKSFLRKDDKPINIESPEGPSYTISGNKIEWQKWKMRVGYNGREGLVIYTVSYNDNGKVRPILYRTSLVEQFIPYGDPRPPYYRKSVYDLGEFGLGFNCDTLKQGEDVLGAVKFFDGILNNSTGDPLIFKNVLSVREEDAGILWKHVDYRTGKGIVVRSHRLVITIVATVGNYEYIFNWQFYQDASIQLNIQLSGILSTNLLAVNAGSAGHETKVAPQINAQYHQHFFSVRMDTEIDGNMNNVYISDAISLPQPTGSPENPYGQGFTTQRTYLTTASNARTKIDPLSGRVWIVTNPNKIHPYTEEPVGWKLMPNAAPPLLLKENSPLRPKASFLDYDFWVTPYAEGQVYPGGFYLNEMGLPYWVNQNPNANVNNTDIVIWYMFGLTHIPRNEDYPIMPVEQVGFWFKPYNFFLENPAIDVPPPGVLNRKDEL